MNKHLPTVPLCSLTCIHLRQTLRHNIYYYGHKSPYTIMDRDERSPLKILFTNSKRGNSGSRKENNRRKTRNSH